MTKDEIVKAVANSENVLTLPMEEVRDAWQYARLGIHVRQQMSNDLRGMGVGHYPVELPEYQHENVRLYRLGTPMAQIINAVLHPSPAHDEELRQVTEGDAAGTLETIRALVCE